MIKKHSIRLPTIIKDNAIGMGAIIFPTSAPSIKTGKKAAIVVRDAAKTGANIVCAARLAASK